MKDAQRDKLGRDADGSDGVKLQPPPDRPDWRSRQTLGAIELERVTHDGCD